MSDYITVNLPDGTQARFPAGMSQEDIHGVLQRQFGGGKQADMSLLGRVKDNLLGVDDGVMSTGEKIGTWLNKAGEAMTFGLVGDEASAAVAAAIPGGMGYDERLAFERANEAQLERENPGAALWAEITGGVIGAMLPGGAIGTLGRGAGMGARIAASGATGAGMGGLYGFMEGEGDERLQGAQTGALWGAGAGVAAPVIGAGVQRGWNALKEPVAGALGIGNDRRAVRAVAQAIERSGRSVSDLSNDLALAAREGQPQYVLADALGNPGQRTLSGLARRPGDQRTAIVDALQRRQAGQGERLSGFIEDSFGFRGTAPGTSIVPHGQPIKQSPEMVLRGPQRSAQATSAALVSARDKAADVAFDAVRDGAKPVDIRGVVAVLDSKIAPFERAGIDDASIEKLRALRSQLVGETSDANFELSDFNKVFQIRRRLRDAVDQLYRSGETEIARDLKAVRSAMDEALEEASDGYRAAMQDFRRASGVIEAVDTGGEMARAGARATDTTAQFSALDDTRQAAARIGYGDRQLARVEGAAGPGTNRARPFTSEKSVQERAVMALDPDRLQRRIDRENVMFETARQATGGSQTADNLADAAESTGFDAPAIVNVLTGNFRSGAQQILSAASQAAQGQNEATRKIIAQALLSRDPQAVLRRAAQSQKMSEHQRQLIETLARRIGVAAPQ